MSTMEESIVDEVSTSIRDLFREPTKGIEKAFHLVLNALKKQDGEQRKVAELYADLKDNNVSIYEKIQRSHESMRNEFEMKTNEIEKKYLEALKDVTEDRKELREQFNTLKEDYILAKREINDLRGELKVRKSNLKK